MADRYERFIEHVICDDCDTPVELDMQAATELARVKH
jgi:hypothetical protein